MAPAVSKIAIIGAGVSGLAVAKQLSHHNPIVFEATDSIGGVWKHCSYSSTKLQSLRCDYEFSDFPWPDRDNTSFPSHTEILEYLHSYANHFDVLRFLRFNTKVVEIKFVGDREATDFSGQPISLLPGHPVWEVSVQTSGSDTIEVFNFSSSFSFFLLKKRMGTMALNLGIIRVASKLKRKQRNSNMISLTSFFLYRT